MGPVMDVTSVEQTKLWKHLKTEFSGSDDERLAETLAANTRLLCEEAATRMKAVHRIHPAFTLHDEVHLLRVTELMAELLGQNLAVLNPIEVALLILAAHAHDQGMVAENDHEVWKSSEFELFGDTWRAEHPNLGEIEDQIGAGDLSAAERGALRFKTAELEVAMRGEYLRQKHGERSAGFIRNEWGSDNRLEVAQISLCEILATLCESHTIPSEDVIPSNGFRCDVSVGNRSVNLRYLALVLRLADILDFDRDRTPDVLFRTVHFTNDVSLVEWEKHRAVQGWTIRPNLIRFEMSFQHPVYERSTREFFDAIDAELWGAHMAVRSFPAEFSEYVLELPERVDRSRIGPEDDAYVYHDLEFSLSRDEIVKLLMTDNLYGSPQLCVRELLQNSLDALRHRKALLATEGISWDAGQVQFEHSLNDEGHEVLKCTDNGIGMDERVITGFLTRVGQSYYRSPFFEQERTRFRQADVDFDPCSQFGIGFISCFMLGDHITIETRRDYGRGRGHGKPWTVEINGLSSMLILREGDEEQEVGTRVTVVSRDKPLITDEWSDRIKLTSYLHSHALAVEFPIHAECAVPGVESEVDIPAEVSKPPTLLEQEHCQQTVTFEQSFSEIDSRLDGCMRETFLADSDGIPTLANQEAAWQDVQNGDADRPTIDLPNGNERSTFELLDLKQTCIDGILVCGKPGRIESDIRHGWNANRLDVGVRFTVDVRGSLKPEVTPGRKPPRDAVRLTPSWRKLQSVMDVAEGRFWEKVCDYLGEGLSHDTLWTLALLHNAWLCTMRSCKIWDRLAVSLFRDSGEPEWRQIAELECLSARQVGDSFDLVTEEGMRVAPRPELRRWRDERSGRSLKGQMRSLALLMSTLTIRGDEVRLAVRYPDSPDTSPWSQIIVGYMRSPNRTVIPYELEIGPVLTVQAPFCSLNSRHPLVGKAVQTQHKSDKTPLEGFAKAACCCLYDRETLDLISRQQQASRWMKNVALRYRMIDWSQYDESLQPPYRIWLRDRGYVEITEDDWQRWAEA